MLQEHNAKFGINRQPSELDRKQAKITEIRAEIYALIREYFPSYEVGEILDNRLPAFGGMSAYDFAARVDSEGGNGWLEVLGVYRRMLE